MCSSDLVMVPGLFAAMGLVIMTGLARTRTVSWRAVGTMYGVGIWCAFAVAVATGWVGELGGLSPQDDGASIALAAFVEEPEQLFFLRWPHWPGGNFFAVFSGTGKNSIFDSAPD